ncbi:MAG: CHAP domain-containing protein [Bacteroidetes bacterium]|nr:CHAP domain-containing protein [Bacteroidota bacterium]
MNVKRLVRGVSALVALLGLTSCSLFSQTAEVSNPIAEAKTKKVEKEILFRNDIVEEAEQYLGTHYRSAGKSPGGFDCSGFVHYIMKEHDIDMNSSAATQEKQGERISKKEAKPGDLVFFRRSPGGRVFHVAMVYENDKSGMTLIHSTSGRGVVMEKLETSEYWRSKIMTFRNVVGSKK